MPTPAQTAQSATVPSKYRSLYTRVISGRASYRQTIKAKCQECCGWEEVVKRVGGCTVDICPLWSVRPYQDAIGASQAAGAASPDNNQPTDDSDDEGDDR